MKLSFEHYFDDVALWAGVASLGLSLVLLLIIFLLRFLWKGRIIVDKIFLETWRPILASCLEGIPDFIPHLPKDQVHNFIDVFNRYQETLRGTSQEQLNTLARKLKVSESCLEILKNYPKSHKMDAIKALGHLQETRALPLLLSLAKNKNSALSIVAAQAMIRIDPKSALENLMEPVIHRKDWALIHLHYIFNGVPTPLLDPFLRRSIEKAPQKRVAVLLNLAERCHCPNSTNLSLELLKKEQDPEIIQTALKILQSPEHLSIAKQFIKHANWRVRLQAVLLLQRIGTKKEIDLIVPHLSDESWWVRYRSAETLLILPGGGITLLKTLTDKQSDAKANRILKMVIAEEEFSS